MMPMTSPGKPAKDDGSGQLAASLAALQGVPEPPPLRPATRYVVGPGMNNYNGNNPFKLTAHTAVFVIKPSKIQTSIL